MARPTMLTCLAALLSVSVLTPRAAQASHRYDKQVMIAVTQQLRYSVERFEQLACRRPLPRHELLQIRLMRGRACKLADAVKCDAPFSQVNCEISSLTTMIRRIDRRLRHQYVFNCDRLLQRSWERVHCDLASARRALDGCVNGKCGLPGVPEQLAPPHVPEAIGPQTRHAPRHGYPTRARTTQPPWLDALIAALNR